MPKTNFNLKVILVLFQKLKNVLLMGNSKKARGEFYGGWITKNLTGPFKGAGNFIL